jgi:hypothetical protein
MNAVLTPSLRRELGLVAWQVRYEQRSYWRNRGRGVFTFGFPLMFLVIFLDDGIGANLRNGNGRHGLDGLTEWIRDWPPRRSVRASAR